MVETGRIRKIDSALPDHPKTVAEARCAMFRSLCELLEAHEIRYVILAGYEGYPNVIESDVDFMVTEDDFVRLPAILQASEAIPGAQLIQVIEHETTARYFVFAMPIGSEVAFLQPDSCSSYRRRGRLWMASAPIIQSRRRLVSGFYVPAPSIEFEYYYIKRVDKAIVDEAHVERLRRLLQSDPEGCRAVLHRRVRHGLAMDVERAISRNDMAWISERLSSLRADLRRSSPAESLGARFRSRVADLMRIVARIRRPTGLIIAVLGPDGSGKSTVIDHLKRTLLPAFRQATSFHLRPYLRHRPMRAPVTNPHGLPPRSRLFSLAKLIYLVGCYWLGWLRVVSPAKICSTLVIFDRYIHDMIADPVRYRLPTGFTLNRLAPILTPSPDLWVILAAAPESLVSRKGEITLVRAEELNDRYRMLAKRLPNSILINTDEGLDPTLATATAFACEFMARRATLRMTSV